MFDHLSRPLPTSLITNYAFSVVATREKSPETRCTSFTLVELITHMIPRVSTRVTHARADGA